jgi:spermidine synthase
MLWFTEYYQSPGTELEGTGLTVKVKSAKSVSTAYQEVMLLETVDYGKMLVIDGAIQTTERDGFIYHEMIVHPAFFTIPERVDSVLIVGGGDGGTLTEVLKHQPRRVDVAEIDKAVVELAMKAFPGASKAFRDARVKLTFADGKRFVESAERGTYDVILVDCSDPVGPSESLYTESFYTSAKRALKKGGVLITQAGSPFAQNGIHKDIVRKLKSVFKIVKAYLAFIPTYPSGMWSFVFASDTLDPTKVPEDVLKGRYRMFASREGALNYYNPNIHYGAFAIPNFVYGGWNEAD